MASGPPAPGSQLAMLPPPPRPPKRKEVVLEEDEWTANLEAIIERDFFPELPKLESKIAWLQAIRSGNPAQIRQAQLLIAQRRAAAAGAGGRPMTGATPAGAPLFTPGGTAACALAGDTPYIPVLPPGVPQSQRGGGSSRRPGTGATVAGEDVGEDNGEGQQRSAAGAAPPVSLDTFMAAHTSEDNASFQEIMENVNKRRRIKAAAQLAPPPDPKLLITDGREKSDGFGSTGQQPDTLVGWKYEPKNALYYDGSNREAVPYSEAELAAQVQGPPKVINHSATRFPRELAPSASATPSASGSSSVAGGGGGASGGAAAAVAGAAGGRPAAAAGGRPAAAAGLAGTRGYDVLATPSFDPGADGETPLMTWGDIEATPMRIEAEDLPPGPLVEGPSFYIKEGSKREQKGQQLSSRAALSLRRRGGGMRGGTPLVTGTLAAAAAARRLATGGGTGAGAAGVRPGSSARPPTGLKAAKPLSEAARRLASSLRKGKRPDTDLALRASYSGSGRTLRLPGASRGPTPGAGSSGGGGGGGWSGAPTPSRGWGTPAVVGTGTGADAGTGRKAGAGTPAVHATLEEEELRVRALMRARQAEKEKGQQLEAARAAAKEALQGHMQQHPPVPSIQPKAGSGGAGGVGGSGGESLTAGLLNI